MTDSHEHHVYVTFWGTRGSISTPGVRTQKYGGNTPCVSVRYQDTQVILDAGTGLRELGVQFQQQNPGPGHRDIHLFLSHTHWDHIQGLPFFVPAYVKGNRITVYGSPKKERVLESILYGQMDANYFPVQMKALAAEFSVVELNDQCLHIGPLAIYWQEQMFHPGGSVRYRIEAGGKIIVYATDVEVDAFLGGPPCGDPYTQALAEAYCEFIRDADLLIADGQYTAEEYPAKVGWGHTSIPLLVQVAHAERVKQLAVFHHDPQHSDQMLDALWPACLAPTATLMPSMNSFWAREALTVLI